MNFIPEISRGLRVLPCLSALGEDDLAIISEKAYLKRFFKDQSIFTESDSMSFFFIVRSGIVKIFKTSGEGREIVVRIMRQNDFSCCAPLYLNRKYFMNAKALEDSELVMIPADYFKEILHERVGGLGLRIITGLCNRIKSLTNLIENLTFKDVQQRVLLTLLRLAEEKSSDDDIVTLTITHQDIASMTGTVREVVSRTMSRLKKEKVIVESNVSGFTIDKSKLLKLLL